jgi:putative transcriptional regulator
MESKQLFGLTILDSLKVILDVPYNAFIKIFSTTNQRALIFTQTYTGRSPLVAIRLSPIKPACIVLHNLKEVDKLAIKIADNEGIPLIVTSMPIDKIKEKLKETQAPVASTVKT